MKQAEKILESVDCKTTMNYSDSSDQEVYYRFEDVLKAIDKALNLPDVITRSCPNCGHDNTKEESVNKHTCRYCEGEPDTNW